MTRLSFLQYVPLALVVCALTAQAGEPAKRSGSTDASSLLYVGLLNGQTVNIYAGEKNQQPKTNLYDGIGNVTGDIAVDRTGHVYVAGSYVMGYPRGGLLPQFRYLMLDQQNPTGTSGLAVGEDLTLYAALYFDAKVVEYQKDARNNGKKASFVIPMPFGMTAFAVAVDPQNNVYIEYSAPVPPAPAYIEKCPPQSTNCTDLGIKLGAAAEHLALDSQGNLLACDQSAAQIDIFPPGGGKPRVISEGLVGCPFFALNKAENRLIVANEQFNSNGQKGISVFDYVSGKHLNTITDGIPADDFIFGVAVSPAVQ